ncbi:hypothetical protein ONZ45_g16670 [Pleurotus djamor]|nr:hypothetical protein ONZ45_g16670 [Pleurotus djamor]
MAPSRADVLAADLSNPVNAHLVNPTHYRTTFLTLRPPLALEQLLSQLKARWVPARQSAAQGPQRNQAISGQQLTIEGVVFAIGTDWLVRAGNVMLSTREMKGMLIEAEYLPVATLHSPIADGTAELLSNLLTAILPNKPDAKTVAVTISDAQWEDVLWDREEEEEMARQQDTQPLAEDDIYAYGDELVPAKVKGDWVGVDRDRRSAYLIMASPTTVGRRRLSTALQFYQNRQLELYAAKEAKRLTLRQLVFFGRSMDEDRLIKSANYVRTELPVRLAHRLRDLQALPYIVVTQEGVAKVYELYWSAFEKFRKYPPITSLEENERYCDFLRDMLGEHRAVIPNLSLGLSLSSPYLPPDQLDSFMRRMLISRISRRVLTEHHLALSEAFTNRDQQGEGEPHVGIIFTGLNLKRSLEHCTQLLRGRPFDIESEDQPSPIAKEWPEVVIEGHLDTKFSYIKEHLEYIIFEILKNAMQATAIKYHDSEQLPPLLATIVSGEDHVALRLSDQGGGLLTPRNLIKTPSDLFSFSHHRNAKRMEDARIGALRSASSNPQGLSATVGEQVGRWGDLQQGEHANVAPEGDTGVGPHTRIGIGLPMSNIYSTYFGGSLELVSLDGWGTDAYVRLPRLKIVKGTNLEGIEV